MPVTTRSAKRASNQKNNKTKKKGGPPDNPPNDNNDPNNSFGYYPDTQDGYHYPRYVRMAVSLGVLTTDHTRCGNCVRCGRIGHALMNCDHCGPLAGIHVMIFYMNTTLRHPGGNTFTRRLYFDPGFIYFLRKVKGDVIDYMNSPFANALQAPYVPSQEDGGDIHHCLRTKGKIRFTLENVNNPTGRLFIVVKKILDNNNDRQTRIEFGWFYSVSNRCNLNLQKYEKHYWDFADPVSQEMKKHQREGGGEDDGGTGMVVMMLRDY